MPRESRFTAAGQARSCPAGHWGAAAPALRWYEADAWDDLAAGNDLPDGLALLTKVTGRAPADLSRASREDLRGWLDECYRWAGQPPAAAHGDHWDIVVYCSAGIISHEAGWRP